MERKEKTLDLTMSGLKTFTDGRFNLKAELPADFETRFLRKTITEQDSFPLYIKSHIATGVTDPIGTVSLAIVDKHNLEITGQTNDRNRHYGEIMETWPLDLSMEIDLVKLAEGRLNRLVLEIGL